MRQGGLILAAGRVRLKKTKTKKETTKSRRTQNPQQPGDRDRLEASCDETRPTR